MAHEHVSLTRQLYDHVPRELLRHLHGTRTRLGMPCHGKLAPRLMLSAGSGARITAEGVGSHEQDNVLMRNRRQDEEADDRRRRGLRS